MAFGRRLLRVLLAAAVAFAPLGPAAAVAHAKPAPAPAEQQTHAAHHHHAAMDEARAMLPAAAEAASPCHGDKAAARTANHSKRGCCCDDKADCGTSCLLKCFGQAAVIAPERSHLIRMALRFELAPVERPPDWRASPHPPPPRA